MLFCGKESDVCIISSFVYGYKDICEGNKPPSANYIKCFSDLRKMSLRFNTKYYTADCDSTLLYFEDSNFIQISNDAIKNIESLIIVLSNQLSVEKQLLELTDKVKDQTIDLKFLILLQTISGDDSCQSSRRKQWFEWSLDNGYEFIEIDPENAVQGWEDREKEGLPRLMEALVAHTWSNLERCVPGHPVSTNSSQRKSNELPIRNEVLESLDERNDESFSLESSLPTNSATNISQIGQESDILSDDSDSEEMDSELWNFMAQAVSQGKQVRDAVLSGSISDDERRRRAELFATQLLSLMKLDESDSES